MSKTILTLALLSLSSSIAHAAHAQLVSMQTQYFANDLPTANPQQPIAKVGALQPVANSLSEMTWDKNKSALSIQKEGVYEFISNIQYGIKEAAKAGGSICYWLEVNGKPLTETIQLISVPLETKANSIRFDSVLPIKAGSQIRFMFLSASPDIGLLSFPSTNESPSVPSVSVSVFKVGNIVNYY